ncbi:replication protein A1-like [Arabidopsis thaliana]|uniref:Replication protein A1-like n=1 Tax=Arabidopsis thaliana TaxID=3702 RepID=Q9LJV1_ARATH|nr:replication protein A1-like [Arabidopsis thaliana]
MGYDGLRDLNPCITCWTICVMVFRMYISFFTDNSFELWVVFVDEWGIQIEAIIESRFFQRYYDMLEENQWKEIRTFGVIENCGFVRSTTHKYMIELMNATEVTHSDPRETVLFNRFTPFDYIIEDTAHTENLVDLVGALVDVGCLRNITEDGWEMDGFRLTFEIMDKYKERLKCEAFGELAVDLHRKFRSFRNDSIVIDNIFVALTWWKIFRYHTGLKHVKFQNYAGISDVTVDPNIEEVQELKMVLE